MFKVGDIVCGLNHNGYSVTNQYAIMEVTSTRDNRLGTPAMRVKIIEHKSRPMEVGAEYTVANDEKKFSLLKPKRERQYSSVDIDTIF